MCRFMLEHLEVNPALLDQEMYTPIFSVEEVNRLVLQGVPFGDAYQQVGQQILSGNFKPQKTVHHSHVGSIGNLASQYIIEKFEQSFAQ